MSAHQTGVATSISGLTEVFRSQGFVMYSAAVGGLAPAERRDDPGTTGCGRRRAEPGRDWQGRPRTLLVLGGEHNVAPLCLGLGMPEIGCDYRYGSASRRRRGPQQSALTALAGTPRTHRRCAVRARSNLGAVLRRGCRGRSRSECELRTMLAPSLHQLKSPVTMHGCCIKGVFIRSGSGRCCASCHVVKVGIAIWWPQVSARLGVGSGPPGGPLGATQPIDGRRGNEREPLVRVGVQATSPNYSSNGNRLCSTAARPFCP